MQEYYVPRIYLSGFIKDFDRIAKQYREFAADLHSPPPHC